MSRSGIDMLEELIKEVKLMREEMKVLDHNIKRIANSTKVSELATKALGTPLEAWVKPEVKQNNKPNAEPVSSDDLVKNKINKKNIRFNFETTDASKTDQIQPSDYLTSI